MMYGLITCLIIIGILVYLVLRKTHIDKTELALYEDKLRQTQKQYHDVDKQLEVAIRDLESTKRVREYNEHLSDEYLQKVKEAADAYNELVDKRMKEVDDLIEETGRRRMESLNDTLNETKAKYDLQLKEYAEKRQKQAEEIRDQCVEAEELNLERCRKIKEETDRLRQVFEGIERAMRQYDAEQQEKLFYTIQLPEEFREDIEFLLTTVAAKVQHPDIISKLVWAEYVKPNLDDTFKRIEIKTEPGIYKLTSLYNGKCYVGKSTNVKNRIADHFKSSIGIKSIADQAVHHAILKEGFWNWQIEVITYCEKDQLNELEKYYIEFFKAQDFGYNKNAGG